MRHVKGYLQRKRLGVVGELAFRLPITSSRYLFKSLKQLQMNSKKSQAETTAQESTTVEDNNVKPHLHKTSCCTLLCLPCGSIVKTKLSNIEGMITCQSIRFDKVQYEISYFNNGEQRTVWMNENEFETNIEKQVIGFLSIRNK